MPIEQITFIEINGALKQLEDLREQLQDMADPNKLLRKFKVEAAAAAKKMIQDQFKTQTDLTGNPWEDYKVPSKDGYTRQRDSSKTRKDLLGGVGGSIYKSIKVLVLADGFKMLSEGPAADYIMFHQHGTRWMPQRRIFPPWSDDSGAEEGSDSSPLEILMNAAFSKACSEMGIEWVQNEQAFDFGGNGISVSKSTGGTKTHEEDVDTYAKKLISDYYAKEAKKGRR